VPPMSPPLRPMPSRNFVLLALRGSVKDTPSASETFVGELRRTVYVPYLNEHVHHVGEFVFAHNSSRRRTRATHTTHEQNIKCKSIFDFS
jgi:hypothetical protein